MSLTKCQSGCNFHFVFMTFSMQPVYTPENRLNCYTLFCFTKTWAPIPSHLTAVLSRTLWTVDCTTTAPSTQFPAKTSVVTTASDNGSNACSRTVYFIDTVLLRQGLLSSCTASGYFSVFFLVSDS